MKRKVLLVLSGVLMLSLLVGGCGSKEVGPIEPSQPEVKPVTLQAPVVKALEEAIEETVEKVVETTESAEETKSRVEIVEVEPETESTSEPKELDDLALLEELFSYQDKMDNYKSKIYMDVDMETEMPNELTGENGTVEGMSFSMAIKMAVDVDVQKDGDLQYTKGTMTTNMFGMNMEVPVETYIDSVNGITYDLSDINGEMVWTKSPADVESDSIDGALLSSIYEEYNMLDDIKFMDEGDKYSVTIPIPMESSGVGDMTGMDSSDMIDCIMYFDKESKLPVRLEMDLLSAMMSGEDMEGVKINNVDFYMDFYDYGKAEVSIPQDVINSAVED